MQNIGQDAGAVAGDKIRQVRTHGDALATDLMAGRACGFAGEKNIAPRQPVAGHGCGSGGERITGHAGPRQAGCGMGSG